MPATAQELVAAGDPQGALALLQQQVRAAPADPKLRVFLFQLLCVLGQWERASTQLQVCGEMDASTLPMVNTYREALKCERVREAVFAGKTTPVALGEPKAWLAWLVEALQAEGRGETTVAEQWRNDALEAAPSSAGTLDGAPFDWIADADSRLGPVLEAIVNGRYCWVPYTTLAKVVIEAPVDLRDLVWAPARLEFPHGGQTVALLPARYSGSGSSGDGALQLSRKTEWIELGSGHFRGLGQRVLTTSEPEVGLLAVREIVLQPEPAGDAEVPD